MRVGFLCDGEKPLKIDPGAVCGHVLFLGKRKARLVGAGMWARYLGLVFYVNLIIAHGKRSVAAVAKIVITFVNFGLVGIFFGASAAQRAQSIGFPRFSLLYRHRLLHFSLSLSPAIRRAGRHVLMSILADLSALCKVCEYEYWQ